MAEAFLLLPGCRVASSASSSAPEGISHSIFCRSVNQEAQLKCVVDGKALNKVLSTEGKTYNHKLKMLPIK